MVVRATPVKLLVRARPTGPRSRRNCTPSGTIPASRIEPAQRSARPCGACELGGGAVRRAPADEWGRGARHRRRQNARAAACPRLRSLRELDGEPEIRVACPPEPPSLRLPESRQSALDQKPEIADREVVDAACDYRQILLRDAEPARQRGGVLVGRNRRNEPPGADVVRPVTRGNARADAQQRVFAVDPASGDRATGDDLDAAPGVIGAVAVGRERPPEVRLA